MPAGTPSSFPSFATTSPPGLNHSNRSLRPWWRDYWRTMRDAIAVLRHHVRDAREFGEGARRKGGSGDAIDRAIELICSRETGADELVGEEGMTHLVAPTLAIDQYPYLFDAFLVDDNAEGDGLFLAD